MKGKFKRIVAVFLTAIMLTAPTAVLAEGEVTSPEEISAEEIATEAEEGITEEIIGEAIGEAIEETTGETTGEAVNAEQSIDSGVSLSGIHEASAYEYDFETVYENSKAKLLIDKTINNLRVVMKDSGAYYDTKVMNGQIGNTVIKNMQKSDFNIVYYKEKVKGSTVSMDSQTMSVELGQLEYEAIDNGIRCKFTVGDGGRLQLTMFPMYISMERLEELVLQYLDDKQRREVLSQYYTETKARVIRNWNTFKKDGTPESVPLPRLRKMYEYFYEVGAYTAEELAIDNAEWGEAVEDTNRNVGVVVDYTLDGSDLIVNIPCSEMTFNPLMPVANITLNPYLMSADFNDNGYIFVPDGSGGIINFNTGKTTPNLTIPIFGSDPLKSPYTYSEQFIQSTLPVFGMQKNGIAILGIIESGAEIASISANIAGRVDEYNKVNVTFELQYKEDALLRSGRGQVMPQYLDSIYSGDITVRYKFLQNDKANYVGMAKEYKEYLTARGDIKQNETPDNAPFVAEFIASTAKKKMFLGISYIDNFSMTSTKEAEKILDSLKNSGISNISAQYTDWGNGGEHSKPLNNISVFGSIGGKKGLTTLAGFCEANGIGFYPTASLLQSQKINGISKANQARMINNIPAYYGGFQTVTNVINQMGTFLYAPHYWLGYAQRATKNLGKLSVDGIAVTDAGALLFGNYGGDLQLMRTDSVGYVKETLEYVGAKMDLMLINANVYAYKYAGQISDLPFADSGRRVIDYTVPFTQMVLENDVPYNLPAYNENIMEWDGFDEYLLKAIESKSGLKFIFTEKDEKEFGSAYQAANGDSIRSYFMTKYSRWEDKIGGYYAEYNDFYKLVKDAEITEHILLAKNFVKTEYSNGVEVYINYTDKPQEADGITVDALSYELVTGKR